MMKDKHLRMMWRGSALYTVIAVILGATLPSAGQEGTVLKKEVAFVKNPSATVEGPRVKIAFEVSRPTDVVVGIVNDKGVVVRHLAGGMLGPHPPFPLQAGSLSQTLVWDRTDDRGKSVPPGAYTVRVSAGVAPKFDRFLGYEALALSSVKGLAVGPKGELFVLNVNDYHVNVLCFSRDLKYQRTILPCPGDLTYGQMKGIDPVQLPDGGWVPRIFPGSGDGLGNICYPGLANTREVPVQSMAATPGGELLFSGTCCESGPRLLRLRTGDGSVPEEFGINVLKANAKEPWEARNLGVSRDGKWAYLSNIVNARADTRQLGEKQASHAVYRYRLGTREPAEPFLGEGEKSGNDEKHFNRPAAIAADGEGNVLVADYGNHRIVVSSPSGEYLGKVAVDSPYGLLVDRKRGTLYILSVSANARGAAGWGEKLVLVKLSGWKEPKALGKLDLSSHRVDVRYGMVLALDDEAEAPIIWMGDGSWDSPRAMLWRIVDRAPANEGLAKPEAVGLPASIPGLRACLRVAVDPATDRVYANDATGNCDPQRWHSFDGNTGKVLPTGKINGGQQYMTTDLRVGYDGTLYGYVYERTTAYANNHQLRRWDLEGNPLPLEGGAEKSEPFPMGPENAEKLKAKKEYVRPDHQQSRGFDVGADGRFYVMHNWDKVDDYRLSVLGIDGKAVKVNLCPHLTMRGCSPRVDRQGNIYVLEGLMPKDVPLGPPGFAGLANAGAGKASGYGSFFGCIVKFPPNGGAVGQPKEMPGPAGVNRVVAGSGDLVDNSIWIRPYTSPAMGSHCICLNAHFDLDRYGRLFVPNALARKVEVLDAEGNSICAFGRYGNVDNGTRDSRRPVDGVPLNWGVDVAVSDRAAYISDLSNRCVVKVRLEYQVTSGCPIP